MANRIIDIELTGNNTKAVKAIEGVGAAAQKAGATAETKLAGASSRIGGAFSKLDTQLAGFGIPFTGALGVMGSRLEATEGKAANFGGSLAKVGQIAGVAGVAGLALAGAESLKLADSFDQAHARVATAVANVGQSMASEGEKITSTDEKLTNLGFTSTDTEAALTPLIGATKDVGVATGLMGLAADIARGRHIDLATATNILVKVETGHVSLLGRLGIATKDAAGHTISQAEALQKLTALYGGQASAYLDTYAGKQAVLGAKADEVGVKLGEVEKTALEHVADATLAGVQGFEKLNAATDGYLGKAAAVGAGGLVVFGAIAKIVDVAKSAATSLGLLSTAEEQAAAATTASQTEAATSTITSAQAQVLAAARVEISEEALAATEAKSAAARATFNTVAAEGSGASATEIIAANRAIEASDSELALSAERAAAAREGAAAVGTGAGIEATGASFAAALGPITLVAAAIGAAGLALNHFFGGDNNAGKIKELAVNLTDVGQGAKDAQDALSKIVGSDASSNLAHYSDVVLANGSAQDKAAAKALAFQNAVGATGGNFAKARDQIDTATKAIDDFAKKNGLAATQTAILGAAQRRYADDLASGTASEQTLASDKQAVVDASKKQATTQDAVNAATQSGIGIAEKAAAAATNQADKAKASAKVQAAAAKELQKQLDAFGAVAGPDLEKVAAALRIPAGEIKNLTAEVKTVDAAFGSSFDKATNDIDKFKDKAKVSFTEFAADELRSIQATTNWSSNLVLLARQGLSLGFIQELAKAGVSSAGLVQSIEDNVKHGSIATTNSLYATGQAAKKQAETAFGAAALAAQSEADKINGLHPTVHVALTGVDDAINKLAQFRGDLTSLNATSSIIQFTYSGPSGSGGVRHFAAGGKVEANKQILVGEKGPELFVPPGASSSMVLGAKGPELWSPPTSGDIIPNDKVKSFAARGAGSHATVRGYADGTAPFGSFGTFNTDSIAVTFRSGSSSSFSAGSVPTPSSNISNFASTYLADVQKVADTTKHSAYATALFTAAHTKYDAAVKSVRDNELKYRQDLFSGKPLAADLLNLDKASKAQTVAHDNYARLAQDRKDALGQQANAKADLQRDSNPAAFAQANQRDAASIQLFQSELTTLLRAGDPLLSRELAGVGLPDAQPLAAAFVHNLRQAAIAEQSLVASNAAQASLSQFESQNFRAAGGPVDPNRSYVVGEKGPEVFVPKSAGTIVPNGQSFNPTRGSQQIQLVLTVPVHVDGVLQGTKVVNVLLDHQRLNGPLPIRVKATA